MLPSFVNLRHVSDNCSEQFITSGYLGLPIEKITTVENWSFHTLARGVGRAFPLGKPPTRISKTRRYLGKLGEIEGKKWGKLTKYSYPAHPRLGVWLSLVTLIIDSFVTFFFFCVDCDSSLHKAFWNLSLIEFWYSRTFLRDMRAKT